MELIREYVFFLTLFLSAFCDVFKRRIPNVILFTGAVLYAAAGGREALKAENIFGAILVTAALFPLFRFRMAGAGDIKLIAFVFFKSGLNEGIKLCLTALFAAGIWALIKLISSGCALKRFRYFFAYLNCCIKGAYPGPYYLPERDGREVTLPFALFIFAALIINII